MAINLKSLQPHKVSTDLSGYMTYIYGPGGAGKTTLFNCISEEIKKDSGEIYILEDGQKKAIDYDRIGFCFSEPKLPDFLTGYEFIKFYIDINKEVIDIEEQEEVKKVYTYKCTVCGYSTNDIEDKMFPDSYSNLYAGWAYHLPICKKCLDKLYDTYKIKHHMTEEEACRRICMNYDIYYCQGLVDIMKKASKPNSRMSFYVSKTALKQ